MLGSTIREQERPSIAIGEERCVKTNQQCAKCGSERDIAIVSRTSCLSNVLINVDSVMEVENTRDHHSLSQNQLLDQNQQHHDLWTDHGVIGVRSHGVRRVVVEGLRPEDVSVIALNLEPVEEFVPVWLWNTDDVTHRNANAREYNHDQQQQQLLDRQLLTEDLQQEEQQDLLLVNLHLVEQKLAQRKITARAVRTPAERVATAEVEDGLRGIVLKCVEFVPPLLLNQPQLL